MNLLHIALINVRKRKRDSISLLLLIFIASLFLNLGVKNVSSTKNSLANKVKETKAIHNEILIKDSLYKESYKEYFESDSRVDKVVAKQVICIPDGYIRYNKTNKDGEKKIKSVFVFTDQATNQEYEQVIIKAEKDELEHAIYVPLFLENYGFKVEDSIEFVYNNVTYTFHIAGFFETTIFGNNTTGALKFIATDETMQYLNDEFSKAVLIGVKCKKIEDCDKVQSDFMKYAMSDIDTSETFETITDSSFQESDEVYSFKNSLISIFITAFSVVIVILVLLIIRVRISNHIEDHLANIGTMGALGYTKAQIQGIYTFEYAILTVGAGTCGTIVAYGLLPLLNRVFQMLSGITYDLTFLPLMDIGCLASVVLCVVLMSLKSSSRVKKYPPVIAFRKGRKSHDFKRNYFDISKERGNLHAKIAAKSIIAALKQHILVLICIAGVSFASVFGIIMYNSFVEDTNTLKRISGIEIADIGIVIEDSADFSSIMKQVDELEFVDHTVNYDMEQVLIDNNKIISYICGDFDYLRTMNCYKGEFPKYEDEVIITGVLAEKLGKQIGDTIDIEQGGYTASYMITGLTQTMSYSGQILMMTSDGIKRVKPTYEPKSLYVYLKKGESVNKSIKKIKELFNGTVTELSIEGNGDGTKEEYTRIKEQAEQRLAVLLNNYGVQNADYSLYIDGITIHGSSKNYVIKQIDNIWSNTVALISGLQNAIKIIMLVLY